MKYDRIPGPVMLPQPIRYWADGAFLLVAGSTHAGEEEMVLDAIERLENQEIRVALVPRHPERFEEVASLLQAREVAWKRFTEVDGSPEITESILLVDAMGVLDGFYELADAAFVGGSLVPVGGHNLLEPAAHGVPVLTGPNLNNFRDIANAIIGSGGCFMVHDVETLSNAVWSFVTDGELKRDVGKKALAEFMKIKGAAAKNAGWLQALIH
jgi:3-deoxy-D-manno-octulosonic-acid transferase